MSSTSLVEFKNDVADTCHEFSNSWGGFARIMDVLFQKYIPKTYEFDSWLQAAQDGRLWKVCRDARLSEAERIVYAFCCDNALVKKEDFPAMATALRDFTKENHVDKGLCHLEGFAKVFDVSDADAIGLHATSVCENPWFTWDEESDETVPYNISTGDKHWFVFESLEDFQPNNEEQTA